MYPRNTGGYDLTMSLDLSFENDRGQVGIGTLIVFIAMVLVAAIAAGVLINTAGLLQDSAEQTGDESQSEVTDRLSIESVTGAINAEAANNQGGVVEVTTTVSPQAGAGPIDLNDLTLSYFDSEGGVDETVVAASEADNDEPAFSIEDVVGTTDNDVMTDQGDKAELTVNLSAGEGDNALNGDEYFLAEDDDAELTVDVAGGGETTTTVEVPVLTGDEERVILG